MTECTGQQVLFSIGKRKVTAVFDGGNLTSDSGVLFLNRIDERLGLSRRMAEVLSDRRQEGKIQHCLRDLFRQRLFHGKDRVSLARWYNRDAARALRIWVRLGRSTWRLSQSTIVQD